MHNADTQCTIDRREEAKGQRIIFLCLIFSCFALKYEFYFTLQTLTFIPSTLTYYLQEYSQDYINMFWCHNTEQEKCSWPDMISIPIKHSGKVDTNSLHKACLNITVFLDPINPCISIVFQSICYPHSPMAFVPQRMSLLQSPGNFFFFTS